MTYIPFPFSVQAQISDFATGSNQILGSNYGNHVNFVSGAASATGTSATQIIRPPASGRLYITDIKAGRTDAGTTAIYITLNDAASTIIVIPNTGSGGGNNQIFQTPLIVAPNTNLTFTSSAPISTVYVSATGYIAA